MNMSRKHTFLVSIISACVIIRPACALLEPHVGSSAKKLSIRGTRQKQRRVTLAAGDVTCSSDSSELEGTFYTYKWGASVASDGYKNQVGDIFEPQYPRENPSPVVVLVHGGYWGESFRRKTSNGSSMVPLALDLQKQGYVAVNLEYRRATEYTSNVDEGGYAGTFNDLNNGIDALAFVKEKCTGLSIDIDVTRIIMVGHSAGGHLALWRTLQFGIDSMDRTGSTPNPLETLVEASLKPFAAIGLAAVSDFGCTCSNLCPANCDGTCGTASCSAVTAFMETGLNSKTISEVGNDLQIWSPYQMLFSANAAASTTIQIKLIHDPNDGSVLVEQSRAFETESGQHPNIEVSLRETTGGSHFTVINPLDSSGSWVCDATHFLDKVVSPLSYDQSCTVVDFSDPIAASGWTHDNSGSTCSTGNFVIGTPSFQIGGDVLTQVCGDHTTGVGNAFYTAANTALGADDVDGGECRGTSPIYPVTEESTVSIWYFHGQRDSGDDASDYFALELSTDGGVNWEVLASYSDEEVYAAWRKAEKTVTANSNVMIRILVSDGISAGDIIEAGVDDFVICPTSVGNSASTSSPSLMPSKSSMPSSLPSSFPTLSMVPSDIPSSQPSESPSIVPTISLVPSKFPSSQPSLSLMPSVVPSFLPSLSLNPSADFTYQPSKSNAPSESATKEPSSTPSSQPSWIPSVTPSALPSSTPTKSQVPSTTPSAIQSDPPSSVPSSFPSSHQPSYSPSMQPTVSQAPSKTPSDSPSRAPSKEPSGAPTTPPTAPTPCFSKSVTVHVKEKGKVTIDRVEVGDHVRSASLTSLGAAANNARDGYSRVYAHGHRSPSTEATFVQLVTEWSTLELTPAHMVFLADGSLMPVPAFEVKVGDVLRSAAPSLSTAGSRGNDTTVVREASGNRNRVVDIAIVKKKGIYAPLTEDGTIVVEEGIVASVFPAQSESSSHFVPFLKIDYLHFHHVSQVMSSPLRLLCSGDGKFGNSSVLPNFCGEAYHNKEGGHVYTAFLQYLDSLPLVLRMWLFPLFFTSSYACFFIECAGLVNTTICFMTILFYITVWKKKQQSRE